MQFIDKNSFNVRSVVYHLKKDGAGVEFLLFPMINVGAKEFYVEMFDEITFWLHKSGELI